MCTSCMDVLRSYMMGVVESLKGFGKKVGQVVDDPLHSLVGHLEFTSHCSN